MSRRMPGHLLAPLGVAALLGLGPLATPAGAPESDVGPTRPNVLIVVTDDQRDGTLGAMDETVLRLARDGRRMAHAYATTPVCCPSRASILTGQYVHNHGVRHNFSADALDQRKTLEFNLKRAGYSTAIFGKFLNQWRGQPPYFDRWAVPARARTPAYQNERWNLNGDVLTVKEYSTDWLADLTIDYLQTVESDDSQPWFAYVSPLAPHAPSTPAERHEDTAVPLFEGNDAVFEADKSDKPRYVRWRRSTLLEAQGIADKQNRTLLAVDEMIARLDDTLIELGEHPDTLVFFLSDNGYTWAEHGLLGPKLSKNTPYTQSIQIPMLMRWPEKVVGGGVERRFTANVDVAPTIYDAANLRSTLEHRLDGRSLLSRKWSRESILLERFARGVGDEIPTWTSLRTRRRQYVENYGPDGNVAFREFYDLQKDPWQLRNLLGDGTSANDPGTKTLHRTLKELGRCEGTRGNNPCP